MEYDLIVVTVFWLALFFVVYTYVGYPLVLYVRSFLRTRPVTKDPVYAPSASFLILAHNEEKMIRRKLEDALSSDYPQERLQIVVASDGSDDGTNEIVRVFQDRGVSLLSFPCRRGKTAVLNDAIPACQGEIIVISDARQAYDPRAIRELVANFRDPLIGAVTGNLQFQAFPDSKDGERIGLYWTYEKWIRSLQSKIDSTPVVTGAIYAIRKSCFRQLPIKCIADDLALPMSIIMQNYRVIFDPSAKAYDTFPRFLKDDFRRRVRTIAGSYEYVVRAPAVLYPGANRLFLDFLSHKVCRVLVPFALVVLFAANLAMTAWVYRMILALQIMFYATAVAGAILAQQGRVPRALSAPYMFLMLNAAAAVALFKVVTGAQTHLWERSQRPSYDV